MSILLLHILFHLSELLLAVVSLVYNCDRANERVEHWNWRDWGFDSPLYTDLTDHRVDTWLERLPYNIDLRLHILLVLASCRPWGRLFLLCRLSLKGSVKILIGLLRDMLNVR